MFLKLTRTSGQKIRVSTQSLDDYEFYSPSSSSLTVNGKSIYVSESVDQIDKLLEECHIFIKGVDDGLARR